MLSSGLTEIIGDDEDLARFLTSSSQFNTLGARPSAFLPNPADKAKSVFRHGSQPRESLWRIADEHLVGGQTLHGAAIVKAKHVRSAQLDVVAQEPPPRHANIVGWPWSQTDPAMRKAEHMERALVIVQWAEVVRR